MLTVIHEAKGRVQQCLSRTGEGAETALCAYKEVQHALTSLLKKHYKTQHAEPTETACRAHFQLHEPHNVMLWHR